MKSTSIQEKYQQFRITTKTAKTNANQTHRRSLGKQMHILNGKQHEFMENEVSKEKQKKPQQSKRNRQDFRGTLVFSSETGEREKNSCMPDKYAQRAASNILRRGLQGEVRFFTLDGKRVSSGRLGGRGGGTQHRSRQDHRTVGRILPTELHIYHPCRRNSS